MANISNKSDMGQSRLDKFQEALDQTFKTTKNENSIKGKRCC